jgi:hypothetical protein
LRPPLAVRPADIRGRPGADIREPTCGADMPKADMRGRHAESGGPTTAAPMIALPSARPRPLRRIPLLRGGRLRPWDRCPVAELVFLA